MSLPLVSIIIPVYNAERYLEETINSALKQTWPNIEIIIVDDGSKDNSVLIAKKFESDNVKVFRQENKGSGATRNKGLQEAKGKYIQFLDADDLLSVDKIHEQVNVLEQYPGRVAICRTVHFFTDQEPNVCSSSAYADSFLYSTDNPVEFLINLYGGNEDRHSMIQTNTWLTPADIIKKAGPWAEFYSPDDDGEFFCRVLIASNGLVYTAKGLNYYRKFRTGGSLSSYKTKEALHGLYKSFLLKRDHLLSVTDDVRAKKALARCVMDIAVLAYPTDKQLTDDILDTIKGLGGTSYVPVMGGKLTELFRKALGWKTVRALQYKLQ